MTDAPSIGLILETIGFSLVLASPLMLWLVFTSEPWDRWRAKRKAAKYPPVPTEPPLARKPFEPLNPRMWHSDRR